MIFVLALTQHDFWVLDGVVTKVKQPINLVRVCRQIHAETALLPYALNRFIVTKPFLSYLGPIYTKIGSLELYSFLEARTPAQIGVMTRVRWKLGSTEQERSAEEWLEIRHLF